MSDVLYTAEEHIGLITINKADKCNAFDTSLLKALQRLLEQAIDDPQIRVLVLKANGAHFSAGADIQWMKSMASYNQEENINDALILGRLMYSIYQCPKPVIAMIQGSAFGGGAGLAAACHIAIASDCARFCFSEVKLGLIPAVISPYVIDAIGARSAQALFVSGEIFDAQKALALKLIHHCIPKESLSDFTLHYAQQISQNAPQAVQQSLQLARDVKNKKIDESLLHYTATLIAQKRVSPEGQAGLSAFLAKQKPNWN